MTFVNNDQGSGLKLNIFTESIPPHNPNIVHIGLLLCLLKEDGLITSLPSPNQFNYFPPLLPTKLTHFLPLPFQYPNDSNKTCEILMNVFEYCQLHLGKLPKKLYIQSDNCCKDLKNQYVLAFYWILVEFDIFEEILGTQPASYNHVITFKLSLIKTFERLFWIFWPFPKHRVVQFLY